MTGRVENTQNVVPEKITPDDCIARPEEILESLHGIVQLLRCAEIDLLILKLMEAVEHGLDRPVPFGAKNLITF